MPVLSLISSTLLVILYSPVRQVDDSPIPDAVIEKGTKQPAPKVTGFHISCSKQRSLGKGKHNSHKECNKSTQYMLRWHIDKLPSSTYIKQLKTILFVCTRTNNTLEDTLMPPDKKKCHKPH